MCRLTARALSAAPALPADTATGIHGAIELHVPARPALLLWSSRCSTTCWPILIKRGADLPLLLIFAGVIGGLITFGLVGIFVGPVVLAVTYTLLENWVLDGERRANG